MLGIPVGQAREEYARFVSELTRRADCVSISLRIAAMGIARSNRMEVPYRAWFRGLTIAPAS